MKRYNLFFENRFGERFFIEEVQENKIFLAIAKDLETRAHAGFQWHYTRTWENENKEKIIDVGSHTENYLAVPIS